MKSLPFLLLLAIAPLSPAETEVHMLGRQSNNMGLSVVPAKGPVKIDGDLSDWDWSGRIHSFADWDIRDSNSVETAAMYDAENLYVAFKWRDPSPMLSSINPDFSPNDGWRSDAVQMRIHTDRNLWITTWYYTAQKMPVLHLSYWRDDAQSKNGQDIVVLHGQPGETELGQGAAEAYKKGEDGKSFTQELRIPWKLLYRTPPKIEAGMVFKLGLEFLWGDDNDGSKPTHRYADNLQPGATSREFFWAATRAWGDAKLLPQGHIPLREYAVAKATLPGLIPIKVTVPEKATHVTVVIENDKGSRIRNLVGDVAPEEYGTGLKDGLRQLEILWDGLDDAGKLVPVGTYNVRGLTRGAFDAVFDSTFYNPGNPPWYTADGTGGFGSNHAAPLCVARAGKRMIASYQMSEGGHALLGFDENDKKIWGDNHGATFLAADDEYVYAVNAEVWTKEREIRLLRFAAKDGSYQPFVLDGKPRDFNLQLKDVAGAEVDATALAVGSKQLALGLADGRVLLLDKASAKIAATLKTGVATSLAFGPKDQLAAIVDGKVVTLDPASGKATPFLTPDVAQPKSLSYDANGNLAIADRGPSSDVNVYSATCNLVATLGKKGGRPVRGTFDPQAMMRVNSIAFDAKGRLWAAENWNYPRRFSIWKPDGSLDHDFIGSTNYAATNTFLHDQDPNLAYCGPIEMKLDRKAGTWTVTRILWYPEEGEDFQIDTGSHVQPQRFRSKASGTEREYMFAPPMRPWQPIAVFIEKGDHFVPVAAIGSVLSMTPHDQKGVATAEPSGAFAGHSLDESFYWNDLNGDAKVQKEELTFVPPTGTGKKKTAALPVFGGWGMRMSIDDLSFYADGTHYKPSSFGPNGEPRLGPEGTTAEPHAGPGDAVEIPGEHVLVNLTQGSPQTNGVDGLRGIDLKTESVKWTYPNPYNSVHGSHRAPLSQPGLVIGPLKIMGTAKLNGDAGSVFAMRGNLGEDYFFTSDGLYVGALFHDTRRPTEELPKYVDALRGKSLSEFSEGGEPFSGWFSRQTDGKYRIATSIARTAGFIVEVQGLDSIQRFQGAPVTLDATILAKADADNAARAVANAAPKSYIIHKVAKPMTIDGKATDWARLQPIKAGGADPKNFAGIKLAYDETNLYVLWEVADATPMLNQGKDFTQLFKSGDAVDLQLGTGLQAPAKRKEPVAGDLRIVIAESAGQPIAVLMAPVSPGAPKSANHTYSSPVGSRPFDRVEVLKDAQVAIAKDKEKYVVEAAIPLASIGLKPEPALEIRGDAGYISSDAAGITNTARTYWSNQNTGLVNDLPGEAALRPGEWGTFQFSD